MKKRYAYAECYRILDVDPACSWDELRRAYKLQIQKWHPDRFADKTAEKDAADDKIKRITAAHQQLVAYYRRHGKLPPPETEPAPQKLPRPDRVRPNAAASSDWPKQTAKNEPKSNILPIMGGILLIAVLFWFNSPNNELSSPKSVRKEPAKTAIQKDLSNEEYPLHEQTVTAEIPTAPKDEKFVTYGSSIGEVISIQGPPSQSEGDIWYYGDSELYFKDGVVIGWKHMPGSKLRTGVVNK